MDSHNLLENLTTSDNPLAGKLSIASLATALLSFASLATVFLSFAGFQGWIKFFLVGATFETCRRAHAWGSVIDSFWFTVDFEEGNRCFGECLPAVMPPFPSVDRTLFCRLDAVVAFATSKVGNGREVCRQ